jgi:hypothetical protein
LSVIVLLLIISFVVYQYEKIHWLFAIIVLLAIFERGKIKCCPLKDFASTSLLSVSAVLFPAFVYMKANAVYFVGSDLFIYFLVLILFAGLLPVIAYFLNKNSLNSISNFSVAFVLSAMFLPLIREVVGYAGEMPIDFVFLFLIFIFIVDLFDKNKKIHIVFFICAAIFAAVSNLNINSSKSDAELNDKPKTIVPKELLDLEIKDDASIYLFMHDSFPRKDLIEFLGLDYSQVEEILDEFGFKVYDVYSIGYYTKVSMTSVFDMKDHRVDEDLLETGLGRKIMSGDNLVNVLLKSKNYLTAIAGEDNPSMYENSLFALGLTGAKDSMRNQVLMAIMQGHLNTMLLKHRKQGSAALQVAQFANANAGKNKIFAWGSAGPDHSSLSLDLDDERKKWSVKYANAIGEIRKELELAIKDNPNAIIILMSDHGPWMLGNPRKDYENVDEIKAIHFHDKYGAFMAIRFPDKKKAAKYDKEFVITQDLFPIVLAYLFDSVVPLKFRIGDTAVRIRGIEFDGGEVTATATATATAKR